PESVTPEPLEYLEYFPEDFAEINIDIIRPDGEPPAVISEYALELPDVGVEYSPCKSPKYHDRYKDKYSYRFTSYDSDGNSHFDEEKYSEICNSGYTGRYMDITFDGKYLYYIISFDDLCQYSTHCFKIMKYDVETAENEELYSYSGTDYYYNNLHIKSINDDLYIRYDKVSDDEESEHRSVAEIDRIKKGRLEKIFDDSTPRLFLELTDYNTDKLILSSYSSYFDENEEYHATGQLYEYNSGKLNEIYSADYDGSYLNTVFPPMRYRNEFLSVETDENDTINIYSDNFRLNTGLRNAKLTSATDKVISFVVQDSLSCFMYVYNFERMERYQLNIKSLADVYGVTPIGDNFILSNGGRTHVFLIPEIGATFLIKSFDESCSAHTDGRMVWIADSESDIIYTDVDGTMPANKPSMLYVV
ncbi:MAG: hypothetical protein K2N49_03245, partial [Ruminococcus sp.]|nr:hypothetical protein [Ruminococcus sp.]